MTMTSSLIFFALKYDPGEHLSKQRKTSSKEQPQRVDAELIYREAPGAGVAGVDEDCTFASNSPPSLC